MFDSTRGGLVGEGWGPRQARCCPDVPWRVCGGGGGPVFFRGVTWALQGLGPSNYSVAFTLQGNQACARRAAARRLGEGMGRRPGKPSKPGWAVVCLGKSVVA